MLALRQHIFDLEALVPYLSKKRNTLYALRLSPPFMHTVVISQNALQAANLAYALRNQNINCSIVTMGSLEHQWFPETDAFLFPHLLDLSDHTILERFLKEIPRKIPLVFFLSRHKLLFTRPKMRPYLAQSIFLDETLPLAQVPLLIKDILQKNAQNKELKIGNVTVDRVNRTLRVGKQTVILSKKEFFLLELLILNSGRITTRENIIDYVWDKRDYVDANTIDVYMSRLRKKLSSSTIPTLGKSLIQTFPCLGYQLNL